MKTIKYLENNLEDVLEDVITNDKVLKFKNETDTFVVLSEDRYNEMINVIENGFSSEMVERIKKGESEDIDLMSTYDPNEKW